MFNPKNLIEENLQVKEMPRFNEITVPVGGGATGLRTRTQPVNYATLMREIKKCPEMLGIANALATDILSDGFFFEDDEGKHPKNKLIKVEEFLRQTNFRSELRAAVLDWILLGNFALWMGEVDEKAVKEIATKYKQSLIKVKAILNELKVDIGTPNLTVKHVPWSTMNIDLNKQKTKIEKFRQIINSGETPIEYKPEEIIHGKWMRLDGKIYGYSPTEAALGVITTLTLIKDYHGYHFDNAGIPDWMFILPKEMAASPNYQQLVQNLKKYKSSKHKGGNLVFTGEVEPTQLNRFDKDMEYRELAIYYTGILALSWNMPLTRVATVLGTKIRASGADLSDAGYWRSISSAQDFLEDILNTPLFHKHFKLFLRFNRNYKDDEVKESQVLAQKMTVAQQMKDRNIVTDEYIYQLLKVPPKYRADGGIKGAEDMQMINDPFNRQNLGKDKDMKGDAQKNIAARKKKEQESKPDASSVRE